MENEVKRFYSMPSGCGVIEGAQTAPVGWVWINNRRSPFDGDYQHALLKL